MKNTTNQCAQKEPKETKQKIPGNRHVSQRSTGSRSSLFVLATTRGISSQKLVDYYPIGVQANMHEITDFATCVNPFDYH